MPQESDNKQGGGQGGASQEKEKGKAGYPSKTGNESGPGRDNNPPKK